MRIVTVPPQTVPGIRKKGHYRQIAELLPEIAFYALEKGGTRIDPPIFLCHECSKEEAMNVDREGRPIERWHSLFRPVPGPEPE